MKFVAILCSFVLFALVSPAAVPIPEKHHEMAKALLKECQTAEGGSDSDYNVMITGEFSDTKEGHCMMTCVNEKIGNIKDGKFNRSGFVEVSKMLINNDEKLLPVVDELADECQDSMTGLDRCEMGFAFDKCLHKAITDRNLDVINLF